MVRRAIPRVSEWESITHDAKLQTRAARLRLRPRKKPYFRTLVPGRMALGYCRTKSGGHGFGPRLIAFSWSYSSIGHDV